MRVPIEELLRELQDAETGTSNPGCCLSCGNWQDGCEPDARNYECEECGRKMVFGAAEILMMGAHT